jgi:hypothetical protein
MISGQAIAWLLSLLVGLVLGLIVWGFVRNRNHRADIYSMTARDDILLGLMILAAFGFGVFLTYALLGLGI